MKSGETHAVMGPNGSGKSTFVLLRSPGHPKYTVTSGSITLDGQDVLEMSVDERARAGLFWRCSIRSRCRVSMSNFTAHGGDRDCAANAAAALGQRGQGRDGRPGDRPGVRAVSTTGFSGGEKKRHEILQLSLLKPKIAILDETDSASTSTRCAS